MYLSKKSTDKRASTTDSRDDRNTCAKLLVIIRTIQTGLAMRVMLSSVFFLMLLLCRPLPAGGLLQSADEFDSIREQHEVAGAAVIVVDANSVLLEHYSGFTDWQSKKAIDRDTWFRIGSVSKAFTGLALLRAVQSGQLRLDQKVSEILPQPQFENDWEKTYPLLVAHLMEHTAGWYDMSGVEFDDKNPKPLSVAEALAMRPQSRVMHWPPGWHSEYTNSGPGLVSYLIEQASGESFDSYLVNQVFAPLGMHSASPLLTPEIEQSLATGYNTDGHSVIPYWHIVYRASGGVNLRPSDMVKFLQMLLNSGRTGGRPVFTEAQISRLETPATTLAAQTGLEYGYGMGIYSILHKRHLLFGHGGDADGFLAHFRYSRESGKAYFVVINAFNHAPIRAMQKLLNDFLVADLPDPVMPDIPEIETSVLELYTGSYRQATVRFPRQGWQNKTLQVKLQGKRLLTSKNGTQWRRLIPVNGKHFRRSNEPVATAAFIPVDGDKMVLQGRMGNWIRD